MGVLLLVSAGLLLRSNLNAKSVESDIIFDHPFILLITLTLILGSFLQGGESLIFIIPLLAFFFYALPLRTAYIVSAVTATTSIIAASHELSVTEAARYAITMALTVLFTARFSAKVKTQKHHLKIETNVDYLTGIANRRSFCDWLDRAIKRSHHDDHFMVLFYIDLDNFKRINELYGHAAGDRVLQVVSARLLGSIRSLDYIIRIDSAQNIARLAGDEFCLVLHTTTGPKGAEIVARRLMAEIRKDIDIDDHKVNLTTSIGIATTKGDDSAETLLKNADAAMYKAKSKGKNCFHFYDQQIADELTLIKQVEDKLTSALQLNQLKLVYMPIYYGASLEVAGVEVLLRCSSLEARGITPDQYIPIAEHSDLINKIDLWVIEKSLQQLSSIKAQNPSCDLFFSINISGKELCNLKFPKQVESILKKYSVEPKDIDLEITETCLVDHGRTSLSILEGLRELGLQLSLDDFGTGYTAFSELKNYPINRLKVDRSFVQSIKTGNLDGIMLDAILAIAHLHRLDVICEGIETEEQLEYLQKSGVEYLQGYFLSKPVGWDDFLQIIGEEPMPERASN